MRAMEAGLAALLPGLALGAVLAAGGAWSRRAGAGLLPHVGVGAVAGVAVTAAVRLDGFPAPLVLVAVAVLGAGLGVGAQWLDRRVRGRGAMPLLPDVVVLAALLGVAELLESPRAVPLPLGPLADTPGAVEAVLAVVIGCAIAVVLAARVLRPAAPPLRWAVAGAGVATVAVVASGLLTPALAGGLALVSTADTGGLAVRVAVAGLAGRGGPEDAALAGLGLGVVEAQLRAAQPAGVTALLPAVVAGVLALLVALRRGPGRAAGTGTW
jgi:hypothetical protein